MGTVTVVGLGAGLEDLTPIHLEAIRAADLLVGGKRQIAHFSAQSKRTLLLGANPTATLKEVKQNAAGKRVVILASGDPLFFGIGRRTLQVFGQENVAFLPNVTALQKAFARIKAPWDTTRFISVHGREPREFFAELAYPGFIVIYTDPTNTPDRLASLLAGYGMINRKVAVMEEIGSTEERFREMDLVGVIGERFSPLNVMVLYPIDQLEPTTRLGIDDGHFSKEKNLITKREARALILAELQLMPGGVMWDVGSGSGSVGIEAVRVVPGLRVYAVEKNQNRIEMIQDNAKRLGGFGVKAILGEAPDSLLDLPAPDRVFIGGSGGRLADILELVESRLAPEGRAVVSVVTPETLGRAQEYVEQTELTHEWLLLQLSRTVPIRVESNESAAARLSRFQPQTPLFLLSLWRS